MKCCFMKAAMDKLEGRIINRFTATCCWTLSNCTMHTLYMGLFSGTRDGKRHVARCRVFKENSIGHKSEMGEKGDNSDIRFGLLI